MEEGRGDRECVRMFVVPYTNLATSSLTTATTKRQQSPKGKQFNRAKEERKAERVERGGGEKEREVAREKRPQGANWTILFCKVAKKCAQREAGEAGKGRGGGTTVKGSVTHR